MITATLGSALRIASATCVPLTLPCSSASTITMSGRISATVGAAFSPLVTTSSILIWVCALSNDRMCDATCGTSSITSNRICSPATPYLSQRPGACLAIRRPCR